MVILDPEYAEQATMGTLAVREELMMTAANYSTRLNFAISDKGPTHDLFGTIHY